jgi:manganese-dependent inorganic pyrophosphatase
VVAAAQQRDVIVISTPYDTFTTARLINQSMPIKYFMTKYDIIHFHLDDYVDEVRDTVAKIRHRDFPILDENQNYVGMFSRRHLMSKQKKQVILVDHNEKTQAVSNIEEAEILEIIDHHRLGSLETMAPVYFRNQPLGCTSTIIYQMYLEKQIPISDKIAGLLCAAILSDTLMFRSPTCTQMDKEAAQKLAELAGINTEEFAQKMFEAGSDFENKTETEILNQDFKIFHSGDIAFGVAQISAMSRQELDRVQKRLMPCLKELLVEKKLDMVFIMLTDILSESTNLVFEGDSAESVVRDAYGSAPQDGVLLKGVVSRKKQLIPVLMNTLAERN